MRLTALQLPARWNQRDAQLALVEQLLADGPTDVVLLPEASLTGYVSPRGDFDVRPFAEALNGPTFDAYARLAKTYDCLFVGPLIEKSGNHDFNSLIGVTPEGALALHYRKHHPWMPETWATPGAAWMEPIEWRGVHLNAAICFDLHFLLEEDRVPGDLLLFSSAWVDEEYDARTPKLEELAFQNQLAILNANWGDGEPALFGQGGSLFIHGDRELRLTDSMRLDAEL